MKGTTDAGLARSLYARYVGSRSAMDLAVGNNVTISINGDAMEVPSGMTVATLLQLLHVEPHRSP